MAFALKDKVVLITGASSGLGEALALGLAKEGSQLALASRRKPELEQVAAACRAQGATQVRVYALDVTRAADMGSVAKEVLKDFGRLDVLINNAGVHAFARVAEMPEGLLREVMDVNLFGPLRMIQAFLPALRQAQGMIVNIGSNLSFRGIPTGGAYSATKGALARLTEALRDEEAKNSVHVLHACPGVVLTKLRDNALIYGVQPQTQEQLPFPRSPQVTAKEIIAAMKAKKREMISAAWPVKIWVKILVPCFGWFLDRRMRAR
jgi:short-subunit dehydrogenase